MSNVLHIKMVDINKLIHLVKQNPCLYDTSHFEYGQTKLKTDIWEAIAAEANFSSGNVAKVEWESLRNRHREALRRQKNKMISHVGGSIKLWQYQTEMQFLLPYMKNNRSSLMNFELSETTYNEYPDEEDNKGDFSVDDCDVKHDMKRLKTNHSIQSETTEKNRQQENRKKQNLEDDSLYLFFISMKCSNVVFEQEEKYLNDMITQSTGLTNSLPSSPRSAESPGLTSTNNDHDQMHSPENSAPVDSPSVTNSFQNTFEPFVEKYEPY
ncbi:hypothetical protein FQR65_LT02793 [Abscondita terminalis]|nr:hypothetical protein FQR65_LT02793 [Abscondita terminalis]